MKVTRYFFLAVLLIAMACSSGKKAYDRGEYYEAVVKAVTRLKQKPDHDKSKETLKSAYPLAVQMLEQDANNLLASSDQFKYKNTIAIYERINQLGDIVKSAPAALSVIRQPKTYYDQIAPLKEKAAGELYEAGIQSMMRGTRKDARQAYFYFRECEAFSPRYKEALEMMTKAEEDGTLRVLYDESSMSHSWTSAANVIRALDEKQFITLYNKDMAVSNLENGAHLNMLILVREYTEHKPQIQKTDVERIDSVKTGEKVVKGTKVPVYEKVKARFTHIQSRAISSGTIAVTIKDNKTGNIVFSNEFIGTGEWKSEWGTFTGDQRALNKNDKKLVDKGSQKPDYVDMKRLARLEVEKQMLTSLSSFLMDY